MQLYRPFFLLAIAILFTVCIGIILQIQKPESSDNSRMQTQKNAIRYVPIGDSYTIGTGAPDGTAWPLLLTQNLQSEGIDIELVTNPAVAGYTVRDAIQREIPVLERSNPTFTTIFIGANDSFQGRDVATFMNEYIKLLDLTQDALGEHRENIVLITIPDYTATPQGEHLADKESIQEQIKKYNTIGSCPVNGII